MDDPGLQPNGEAASRAANRASMVLLVWILITGVLAWTALLMH